LQENKLRNILNYLGIIIMGFTVVSIPPIITAIIYGESGLSYAVFGFVSLVTGFIILQTGNIKTAVSKTPLRDVIDLSSGIILSALSFIVVSILGSIPYIFYFKGKVISSIFESVSGYTTAGLTVFNTVSDVPMSLLFYRAETQWVGGIGIIIVFIFILQQLTAPSTKISGVRERTESIMGIYKSQGYPSGMEYDLRTIVRNIFKIYGIYTVIGIVLLLITGLSLYEAITMTFTALPGGGFSVVDNFYTEPSQLMVFSLLMIISALSFVLHVQLFKRKLKELFRNYEAVFFFMVLILFTAISFIVFPDVKVVLFTTITSLTTTGFTIIDINALPPIILVLVCVAMVIGGSSVSAAGGMKLFRVREAVSSVFWYAKKLMKPRSAVIPFKIRNKAVEEKVILASNIYIIIYIMLLITGTLIFMFMGYGFFDSIFQNISALSTVGLSTMSTASIPAFGKLVLIAGMLLGRLEVFPIIVLLRRIFRGD